MKFQVYLTGDTFLFIHGFKIQSSLFRRYFDFEVLIDQCRSRTFGPTTVTTYKKCKKKLEWDINIFKQYIKSERKWKYGPDSQQHQQGRLTLSTLSGLFHSLGRLESSVGVKGLNIYYMWFQTHVSAHIKLMMIQVTFFA